MNKRFKYCPLCRETLLESAEGGHVRMRCGVCGFVQYLNPAPAAGVLITDDLGRILLVRRRYDPYGGMWGIPSGYVEYDEEVRLTAVRELEEEAGVSVELDGIHAVESCFDDPRGNTIVVIFRGHITGGSIKAGDDADDAGFFPLDKLPQIAFDCQKRIIADLKDKQVR